MADILVPDARVQSCAPRIIDATARFNSPLSGTTRTLGRPGDRWGFQLTYNALNNRSGSNDKARMEAFITIIRGAAHRAIFSPVDYVQRGSFSAPELLQNSDFSQGTTGYTPTNCALSAVDRILRATRNTPGGNELDLAQTVTTIPYTPYAIRAILSSFLQNGTSSAYATYGGTQFGASASLTSAGLASVAVIPSASSFQWFFFQGASNSNKAGDFFELSFASFARCFLIDNRANALQFSDQIDNVVWTKQGTTVTANLGAAPDGTLTADAVLETTANSTHHVNQTCTKSAVAQDWEFHGFVRGGLTRTKVWVTVDDGIGTNAGYAEIDLNTGTVSNVQNLGTFTNCRCVTKSMGNSWLYFSIIALTTTGTSARGAIGAHNGTTITYAGNASDGFYFIGGGLAQSSVAVQCRSTTAAQPSGTGQSGSSYNVKGLPVSANGLLLPGDWCEINGELKKVTASLNSDAAGIGLLQFTPPIRTAANDNDPVIVNRPMGRFIFKDSENGWQSSPGVFSDYAFDLIEAIG